MSNNRKITSDDIDKLLYQLQILETIKIGDKLCCNMEKMVIDNSWIPFISRWWIGENRSITIEIIKDIINEVISITDNIFRNEIAIQKNDKEKDSRKQSTNNFFKYSNQELLKKILFACTYSVRGIKNLQKTYETDQHIQSELEIFIEKLSTRINKIDNSLEIIL